MTPLTRKENYLNEIVGWGNTAPEKPTTPEEFFFAAILGEAVQVPDLSNASRYELFLAKIAGYNVNVSPPTYTSPRLEFFLAKAAGMDVVTPVPLTKEEIFWANYKGREQIIEGVPPLTFTAKAGTLSNYRIYGNTVNGESVGGRTGNLFSAKLTQGGYTSKSKPNNFRGRVRSSDNDFVFLNAGTYTISWDSDTETAMLMYAYNSESMDDYNSAIISAWTSSPVTFSAISDAFVLVTFKKENNENIIPKEISNIMLSSGSIVLPYEPYGYRVPITVNSNTTNIYLDEQLVKSGDDADYIDYDTQKRYNADGTTVDVELPTLQTVEGTNTLSVETTVQPSKVVVKGEIGGAS